MTENTPEPPALGDLFKKGAGKVKERFMLLRPLSKKEQWSVDSLKEYISEDSAKKALAAVKQNKAELKYIKKGFSFLIANKDLIPQLDSGEFEDLNKQIEKEFYATSFKNFAERAWGALPQYIGPNTLGQTEIKQAITLQLFSPEPIKLLILGKINAEMLTFARKLAPPEFQIITNFSPEKELDFEKPIITKTDRQTKHSDKFDLLFFTKTAVLKDFEDIAEKIITGSKAKVKDADLEFLKEYIEQAREIEVEIPAHLVEQLKKFIVKLKKEESELNYSVTTDFVAVVVSLCKAAARMEMRSQIDSKDLVRVFDIVEKSIRAE